MGIRLSARYQWEDTNSPPFFDKTFVGSRITIGNDPAASLCLNGSVLSAEQIVIIDGEGEPQIINQAEGTALNGELLDLNAWRPIRDGDLLSIGTYQISIFLTQEPSSSDTDHTVQDDAASVARRNGDSKFAADSLEDFLQAPENKLSSSLPAEESANAFRPDSNHRLRQPKSFAAILDSLRTDEDRFYFVIEGGKQSGVRVPIELEEMPVGWDDTSEHLCFDISSIADLCAIVRKDWSGVILRTQTAAITVNNEPLEDERRLRDGDRLLLRGSNREDPADSQVVLIFREPTSLVILDSLMPRVPPALEDASLLTEGARGVVDRLDSNSPAQKLAALIKSDKEYFTVFTFVELSLMAIGTIFGAVIIFLILNYS